MSDIVERIATWIEEKGYLRGNLTGELLRDSSAEITRLRNLIREEQEKLRARLAAWKAEAEAWRQSDDCDPMVRGECIREARERRAATDAMNDPCLAMMQAEHLARWFMSRPGMRSLVINAPEDDEDFWRVYPSGLAAIGRGRTLAEALDKACDHPECPPLKGD